MQVMSCCFTVRGWKGSASTDAVRSHSSNVEVSDGLLVKSKTSFYRYCGNWGYLGRREVENSKTFDKIEDQHSRFKIQDSRFKIQDQHSRLKI